MHPRAATADTPGWTPARPASDRGGAAPIVDIRSLSGGCGASTLAAAVAARAALAGRATVLVDMATAGAPADVVTGVEQDRGVRWDDLVGLRGEASGRALISLLPVVPGTGGLLRVLSRAAHPPPSRVRQAVLAALVGAVELLVIEGGASEEPIADPPDGVTRAEVVVTRSDVFGVVSLGRYLADRAPGWSGRAVLRAQRSPGATQLGSGSSREVPRLLRDEFGVADPRVLGEDRSIGAGVLGGRCPGLAAGPVREMADVIVADLLVGRP